MNKDSRRWFRLAFINYRQGFCEVCERMRCGLLRVDVVWPNDYLLPSPTHPACRMHHIKNHRGALLYLMREYLRGNVRLICNQCDNIRINAFRGRWFPVLSPLRNVRPPRPWDIRSAAAGGLLPWEEYLDKEYD